MTFIPRRKLLLIHVILVTALASGCAKPREALIVPGKTTAAEAERLMGVPKATIIPPSRPQAKLVDFLTPGNCRVQFEKDIAFATYCDPADREVTLQYWRHQWKGQSQRYEEIADSRDVHGQALYQLVAPELRMAVVYNPASDRIVRVVKYAAH